MQLHFDRLAEAGRTARSIRRNASRALRLGIAGVAATAMVASAVPAKAQGHPFRELAGDWRGSGVIQLNNGSRERLTCRGRYSPRAGGNTLLLGLLCASPSYRIDIRSDLVYRSGRIQGRWQERSFNTGGNVSGSASARRLNLAFSGGITGSMSVALSGSRHRVSISTNGSGFAGVSITLSRG